MAETPNLEKVAKRGKKSEVSKSGTKKSQKNEENNSEEYYCKYCDYFTLNKSNYAKHINTRKHQTKQKMALLELNGTLDDTENEKTDDREAPFCKGRVRLERSATGLATSSDPIAGDWRDIRSTAASCGQPDDECAPFQR